MAEPSPESSQPIAEISHEPSKLDGFFDRNLKWLIAGAVLVAVGVAAFVVNQSAEEGARRAGGEALVAAEEAEGYEKVVETHADTPSALSAAVRLSDRQWEQGGQAAALETLRGAIERDSGHPAIPSAKARLAARLLQQGELDQSEALFAELADSPRARFLAPFAMGALADIERRRGDAGAASEILEEAIESHPGSPFNGMLADQRRFVNFEMPEEVEPPAAEENGADAPGAPGLIGDDSGLPDFSGDLEFDPGQGGEGGANPLINELGGDAESSLESDSDRRDDPESGEDDGASEESRGESADDAPEAGGDAPESESSSPSADPAAENGE